MPQEETSTTTKDKEKEKDNGEKEFSGGQGSRTLEERRRSMLDHHWAVPSKDRTFSVDDEQQDSLNSDKVIIRLFFVATLLNWCSKLKRCWSTRQTLEVDNVEMIVETKIQLAMKRRTGQSRGYNGPGRSDSYNSFPTFLPYISFHCREKHNQRLP